MPSPQMDILLMKNTFFLGLVSSCCPRDELVWSGHSTVALPTCFLLESCSEVAEDIQILPQNGASDPLALAVCNCDAALVVLQIRVLNCTWVKQCNAVRYEVGKLKFTVKVVKTSQELCHGVPKMTRWFMNLEPGKPSVVEEKTL